MAHTPINPALEFRNHAVIAIDCRRCFGKGEVDEHYCQVCFGRCMEYAYADPSLRPDDNAEQPQYMLGDRPLGCANCKMRFYLAPDVHNIRPEDIVFHCPNCLRTAPTGPIDDTEN